MRRLSDALKERYGEKVYKISLASGCTCPNRDGSKGVGGCTFCSGKGSGDFAAPLKPVDLQIEEAKELIKNKTDAGKYIAYFQSYTNTYGDLKRLEKLYTKAAKRDDIVGISLGTRPDCLESGVIAMLKRLDRIKPVWVELGLQTVNDETAEKFNRCYPTVVFDEGYGKVKSAGFTCIVHVIFGLPGESREDMLDTVRHLASLTPPPDGIKIQMLHVMKGTELGKQYMKDPFPLLTLEEYSDLVAESMEILPDEMVIHRMTGDAPGPLLIAPEWTRNKKKVLNTINRKLRERGIV